jgi:TRAP-type C4-dicarboxylate transport system permease small subunit
MSELENHSSPEADKSLRFEDWTTVSIMAALAFITFANVIARYFTNQSFAWTEEFSIFLMLALTLVAGSAAAARNTNIRIEIFADSGSFSRRKILSILSGVSMVLMFSLMTYLGGKLTWDEYSFGETSPGIGVPKWWYTIWLPIFSAVITIRSLIFIIKRARQS